MPCYRTHLRFNILLALPFWIFFLFYGMNPPAEHLLFFSGAFIYGSYFFHPDLDLAYKTRLFTVKGILTLPFRWYGIFFRHRGISHHWILGTCTRLLWILTLVFLLFCLQKWSFPKPQVLYDFLGQNRSLLIFFFLGLFLADLSHVGLDSFVSKARK